MTARTGADDGISSSGTVESEGERRGGVASSAVAYQICVWSGRFASFPRNSRRQDLAQTAVATPFVENNL